VVNCKFDSLKMIDSSIYFSFYLNIER
jgi:hypothetical protein